jgi:rhodanese-related sulfurtransferase
MKPLSFVLSLVVATSLPLAHAQSDMTAREAHEAAREGRVKLLDIRTPEEWRETGIPSGAARADFHRGPEALVRSVAELVGGDRNAPVVLICRTGNRSAQAQKILKAHGYTRVSHVREGMAGSGGEPGWLKRGLPVESCRC